jgi:predicted enzyme related to lactoylglutathione lyase
MRRCAPPHRFRKGETLFYLLEEQSCLGSPPLKCEFPGGLVFSHQLAWVAVVSREPQTTAQRLNELFGLPRTDIETSAAPVPILSIGRSGIMILPPGHALAAERERPGVDHVAIAVEDIDAAAAEAECRGFRIAGPRLQGPAGSALVPLAAEDLQGVRVVLATPLALPSPSGASLSRIDHLGIASNDAFGAIKIFHDRLGLPVESTQTDVESVVGIETFTSDRYGVVHHSRPARIIGGLRVSFLTIGDCELEFLQNLDPGHTAETHVAQAGTTKQDQGAITRYIARHGPGLHHVALKTEDIDGDLERAAAGGIPVIDRCGRPGSRRGLIGFFHPDAFGGVLFHLVERPDA